MVFTIGERVETVALYFSSKAPEIAKICNLSHPYVMNLITKFMENVTNETTEVVNLGHVGLDPKTDTKKFATT